MSYQFQFGHCNLCVDFKIEISWKPFIISLHILVLGTLCKPQDFVLTVLAVTFSQFHSQSPWGAELKTSDPPIVKSIVLIKTGSPQNSGLFSASDYSFLRELRQTGRGHHEMVWQHNRLSAPHRQWSCPSDLPSERGADKWNLSIRIQGSYKNNTTYSCQFFQPNICLIPITQFSTQKSVSLTPDIMFFPV